MAREAKLQRILAKELQARGKLQLEEAFIDASFTGAKKGGSRSGAPSAAKERKSSLSPMTIAFHSPLASKALRCMKASLLKASSDTVSSTVSGEDWSATEPITVTVWIVTWPERYGIAMIVRIAVCVVATRGTVVLSAIIAGVGESSDFSLGSISSVGWWFAGNTTSRTSLAWSA